MSLDQLAEQAYKNAEQHGFHEGYDFSDISWQLMKLALIHSEVSELLEALRKDKGEDEVMSELSDILIRTLDLYQALREGGVVNQSLDEAYERKSEKNKARPTMHGVKA